MPSMLLPPQFHAAVSPGFMSLLLLMLTGKDLRKEVEVVVAKPNLCRLTLQAVQRDPTATSEKAMVSEAEGASLTVFRMVSKDFSSVDVARTLIRQEVSWRLSEPKSSHGEAGGI